MGMEIFHWRTSLNRFCVTDRVLRPVDVFANRKLDLTWDHLSVATSIEYVRSAEARKFLKHSFKAYTIIRD